MMDDRIWWQFNAGEHYRELAAWLREVAAKCRLPNPQQELQTLAPGGVLSAQGALRIGERACDTNQVLLL
jgi:hypothetical protein